MKANYEMMDSISDKLNSITDDMLENMKQAKNLIGKLKNVEVLVLICLNFINLMQ